MTRTLAVAAAAAGLAAAATPAPPPTKGACAGAWNRHAPPSLLAEARARHVWQATVQETTVTSYGYSWSKGRPATTRSLGTDPGCTIVLFLPRGESLILSGLWHAGTVRWGHPLEHARPPGSGNACVAADGTIHRVGRFTAAARCPRVP